ncbi:MAG: T9SS type A sorting domain-containing protein [Bacteroidetes bacterium]|nr:T9SS type A sorting domain-containing protein [Bacteroidota bacterium]MCL2302837.1 T9SS type A sorting domain-containing protein [Lentimicrobiaceae bacterium]
MKNFFTLITCMMVVVSAFATQPKFKQLENKPTLKPTIDAKFDRTDAYDAKFAKPEHKQLNNAGQKFNKPEAKVEETPKTPSLTARMDEIMPKFDPKNLSKISDTKDYHKWDSLQLIYPDGSIVQTMYLTYTIIDGLYWPALLTIKDMATGMIVGERGYEYHTEGPLKGKLKNSHDKEFAYGAWFGGREVYHYNVQGLVDTVFAYKPDMITAEWELEAKYVYDWDANQNIAKLVIWQPLISTGEWVITVIQTAEYHPDGSRKNVVAWGWAFSWVTYQEQWEGIEDNYEWFMEGVPTLWRTYLWEWDNEPNTDIYWLTNNGVPTDGKFVGSVELIREFSIGSGYLLMTLDKWSYWNEENQDWNGNFDNGWDMVYNREERFTFSGPEYYHRRTGSQCKKLVGTDWVLSHGGYTETYVWKENPNHATEDWRWEVEIKSIIHGPGWWGAGDMIYQIDSIRYPKFEPNTHTNIVLYHKYINYPEIDLSGREEIFQFNAAGKQIDWKMFELISEGMAEAMGLPSRYGLSWESIEYDANNFPSKSIHRMCRYGLVGDDPDDWDVIRVFEYEHINGYRTYQMAWDDEAMTIPSYIGGRRLDFDWDIPLSDIIMWQDMYLDGDNMTGNPWFPALIKTKTIYYVEWGSTTIDEYIHKYFYSIETVVSIQEPMSDGQKAAVAVYPNPVNDVLYIKTEQTVQQVFVFDFSGRLVMQMRGDNNSINLQSLPTGSYVARIHTDKAVVPMKIVKQ